ncbi:MAG: hypothetical protein ACI9G1_002218 [Pirellulaceae bacterium]
MGVPLRVQSILQINQLISYSFLPLPTLNSPVCELPNKTVAVWTNRVRHDSCKPEFSEFPADVWFIGLALRLVQTDQFTAFTADEQSPGGSCQAAFGDA